MKPKPTPPVDLWAQIDAAKKEAYVSLASEAKPEGCITTGDYADHYKIGREGARAHLQKCVRAGTMEVVGRGPRGSFYYRPIAKGVTHFSGDGCTTHK